ncbi:MAG: type II toxin-antitoxin system VapC family toxin [Saprospiraceae bacterium]
MKNYLLDTHTLLWSIFESHRLPPTVQQTIRDPAQNILVSAVSLWEISLKYRLGKLHLDGYNPSELVDTCQQMQYAMLPLSPLDAATYHQVGSDFHKDPFDRMLIHQAIQHKLILLTKDPIVRQYAVEGLQVLWD